MNRGGCEDARRHASSRRETTEVAGSSPRSFRSGSAWVKLGGQPEYRRCLGLPAKTSGGHPEVYWITPFPTAFSTARARNLLGILVIPEPLLNPAQCVEDLWAPSGAQERGRDEVEVPVD